MPKLISNLVKGRGAKASALLTPPKALLLVRPIGVSGGYAFLGGGLIEAAVMVVSPLTEALPTARSGI